MFVYLNGRRSGAVVTTGARGVSRVPPWHNSKKQDLRTTMYNRKIFFFFSRIGLFCRDTSKGRHFLLTNYLPLVSLKENIHLNRCSAIFSLCMCFLSLLQVPCPSSCPPAFSLVFMLHTFLSPLPV